MDEDLTSDLSPDQLADLLGIAFDAPSNESNDAVKDTHAQLIEAHLVGALALDTSVLDNLPTVIAQLDTDIFGGGGETLGKVLADPMSDMEIIKKIKRYAKGINSQENSEGERTVAIVLYYAAIANALLFHKTKITAHSHETLKAEFNKLSAKPWMSKELAHLFSKGVKEIKSLSQ